ncbi:hypothetical protein EVAR_32871_1 [Eumeta japonica]|uniref:Uncharacterized protein n=1 Tax=Eumeta variegata TaxID=151549 RepID=A0A4C1VR93_EUMVA|nr:hypothetical protein EVAR_32871_1 [Eumeta japonica]
MPPPSAVRRLSVPDIGQLFDLPREYPRGRSGRRSRPRYRSRGFDCGPAPLRGFYKLLIKKVHKLDAASRGPTAKIKFWHISAVGAYGVTGRSMRVK